MTPTINYLFVNRRFARRLVKNGIYCRHPFFECEPIDWAPGFAVIGTMPTFGAMVVVRFDMEEWRENENLS